MPISQPTYPISTSNLVSHVGAYADSIVVGGGEGGTSPFVNLGDPEYGANPNGQFDNKDALAAAFADLATGGTLLIPGNGADYYSSLGFEFQRPIGIRGMGLAFNDHNHTGGKFVSKLSFPNLSSAALSFIGNPSLGNAAGSSIEDIIIRGSGGKSSGAYATPFPPAQSSSRASGRGVLITANSCSMKKVYIEGFSGHGLDVNTNSPNVHNANFCTFINVSSKYNGRDGIHVTGINSNLCNFLTCDGSWNRGYGIFNGAELDAEANNHASGNRFIGCHVEANKTGAAVDNSDGSYWEGLYAEGGYAGVINWFGEGILTNATETFTIGPYGANGRYWGTNFTAIRIVKMTPSPNIYDGPENGAPALYPGYRWLIINPLPLTMASSPFVPADAGTTYINPAATDSAKLAAIYDWLVATHQIRRA